MGLSTPSGAGGVGGTPRACPGRDGPQRRRLERLGVGRAMRLLAHVPRPPGAPAVLAVALGVPRLPCRAPRDVRVGRAAPGTVSPPRPGAGLRRSSRTAQPDGMVLSVVATIREGVGSSRGLRRCVRARRTRNHAGLGAARVLQGPSGPQDQGCWCPSCDQRPFRLIVSRGSPDLADNASGDDLRERARACAGVPIPVGKANYPSEVKAGDLTRVG
jgi:hypothetical protein